MNQIDSFSAPTTDYHPRKRLREEEPANPRPMHKLRQDDPKAQTILKKATRDLLKTYTSINERYYDRKYSEKVKQTLGCSPSKAKIIGRGTFGKVYQLPNNQVLKAQSPHKSRAPDKEDQMIRKEIQNLQHLKKEEAPHVVQIVRTFSASSKRHALILQDAGSNLYQIYRYKNTELKDLDRIGIQILEALDHIHTPTQDRENAIVHFDLKLENIAENDGQIQVLDFGLAERVKPESGFVGLKFSRFYRPFEAHIGLETGPKGDIWSLGCVLFELYVGEPLIPITDNTPNADLNMIYAMQDRLQIDRLPHDSIKKKYPHFYDNSNRLRPRTIRKLASFEDAIRNREEIRGEKKELLIQLLSKMLQLNPKDRQPASELLKDPFFSDYIGFSPIVANHNRDMQMGIYTDDGENLLTVNLKHPSPCYHIPKSSRPYTFVFIENGEIAAKGEREIEDHEVLEIDPNNLHSFELFPNILKDNDSIFREELPPILIEEMPARRPNSTELLSPGEERHPRRNPFNPSRQMQAEECEDR